MNDLDKILYAVVLLHTEVLDLRTQLEKAHPELRVSRKEIAKFKALRSWMEQFEGYATRNEA